MNRNRIAVRLSLIVALAGLLPLATLGAISIELLRRRSERISQESLQAIAEQAAARIRLFLSHQKQLVRTLAAFASGPEDASRLSEAVLEAPGLGRVELVGRENILSYSSSLSVEDLTQAIHGAEINSEVYFAKDTTPAMDLCVPTRAIPNHALCAQLDLLELWLFVQGIRIGSSGYALAFGRDGQLLASGLGAIRGAILTREPIRETPFARIASLDQSKAPTRYLGPQNEPVIAGWSRLADWGWSVAVEQPLSEALRTARVGQWILAGVLVFALFLSVAIGAIQSQKVLRELEAEERWRTAGRIAAGVTHDLGHRLRLLQQTAALAEAGRVEYLPRISANLRSEVSVLEKFVADFSDLARNMNAIEPMPLDLVPFLESVRRVAAARGDELGVGIEIHPEDGSAWALADRHLLERAVLNLVSNAIEASPRGSVVTLSAAHREQFSAIEVQDRGAGIARERIDHLFDAFASTKKTGAHIGMGLPNVKRIAEAHGGRVSVHSEVGKGTTFSLLIPATSPAEYDAPKNQLSGSSSGPRP